MKDLIYLYHHPFVERRTPTNEAYHLLDYFDENDRQDEEKIRAHLLRFVIEEKIIQIDSNNIPVLGENKNTGSWEWQICWMNFRSLSDMKQYSKLMTSLQHNNNYAVNNILDLHMKLGCLFNKKLLNSLVNRILNSVPLIPYDIPDTSTEISWEDIHRETPFIWLVILLQIIIKSNISNKGQM